MAVVANFNRSEAAERIVVEHDVDLVRICIDRVPNQLSYCENWLSHLRNSLKVIVLNLNLECLGGHVRIVATTGRSVKDNVGFAERPSADQNQCYAINASIVELLNF